MGMFSFIDKPFRTGRTQAAKNAERNSLQSSENFQQMFDLMKPSVELGQEQLGRLQGFSTPEGMNDLYNDLSGGDLAQSMMDDRMDVVESTMASSGLRRSGSRLREAANVPTNVLMGLMDKIMGVTQNSASLGLGQGSTALGALTGSSNALNQASQFGMIPAENRAATQAGLINMAGDIGKAVFASDERLKTNINAIGEVGPLTVYEWDWIDESLGMAMSSGFIAQQVQEIFPQHVHPFEIDGFELLAVDYDAVLAEVAHV